MFASGLRGETLDYSTDLLRLRDMSDGERADDHGSIAKELPEQRLVDLDGVDRLQADRLRTPAKGAVDDVDLVRSDHEACALPRPDGSQKQGCGRGRQER